MFITFFNSMFVKVYQTKYHSKNNNSNDMLLNCVSLLDKDYGDTSKLFSSEALPFNCPKTKDHELTKVVDILYKYLIIE